jgi:hypothetical protein
MIEALPHDYPAAWAVDAELERQKDAPELTNIVDLWTPS